MKIGIKLWSINTEWILYAAKLAEKGVFDFLELYVVPGSLETLSTWKKWSVPTILHAAHSHGGLNMATPGIMRDKRVVFEELNEFRDALDAYMVIFHPGVDGAKEDTVANFMDLKTAYPKINRLALLENKPLLGLNGERCVGASPEEVIWIIDHTEIGFCLDFGHAIAAANSFQRPWRELIAEFSKLSPSLYHLSDGDMNAEMDSHLNLGVGDYPIAEIAELIPHDAFVTLETAKDPDGNLNYFIEDVKVLSVTPETRSRAEHPCQPFC